MSTRWWAPTESEQDWRAMLTPGTDPEKDLGLYLLAAHRAGAGQLVEVAKSSLASEVALVDALSTFRPELSEPMIDAIAPITGEGYAALLVRDVLDEADLGALHVYRIAVSKGVPPPIALERAAAGYGVPAKEMGAFAALAADPKANPRAVEDAADRSLMTYVAKVAAQEAVSEVSKASPPREDRTLVADTDFDPALHPRGPDGRFVETPDAPPAPLSALDRIRQRLGLLSTEPTRVAETVKEPTLTPSKKPGVELRQARAKRAIAARQRLAAKAPSAAPAPLQRKASSRALQRKVSRAKLNRLTEQLNLSFKGNTEPEAEPRILPDLLQKLPDPGGDYYDLGQPVVIGTSHVAGWGVRQKSADQAMSQKDPSRRIFRIGHLVNEAKYVEQQGVAQVTAHEMHAEAELTGTPVEYAHPIVRTIKHHELTNPAEDFRHADRLMDQMVTRDVVMPSGDVRPVVDYDERNHVQALPVYEPLHVPVYDDNAVEQHDHEEAIALVHWQPADPNKPDVRPIPYVEEYVILTDARGYEEGTGRSVDIHLDPNQVYEVVPSPNARPGSLARPEAMYDLDNQVVVNRWYLRPVDHEDIDDIIEGFDKALSPAELETFNRLHPRDAEGQFTETEAQVAAPTKKPGVALRQARQRKARAAMRTKTARTLTPVTQAKPLVRQSLQRKQSAPARPDLKRHPLTTALGRKVAERAEKAKAPVLTDARIYKLMPEQFFQNLFPRGEVSDEAFLAMHRGKPLELNTRQRMIIGGLREIPVDAIGENMVLNVNKLIDDQQVHRELLAEIPMPPQHGAVPDYDPIAEDIDHILRKRPDLDLVEIGLDDESKVVMVFGSKVSGAYQNLVEIDPDLNMAGPLYLNFVGEHRAGDLLAQGQSAAYSLIEDLATIETEGAIPNPYVHYYRLTSVPMRRFRVDGQ